jgi:hypothetical protein
LSEIRGGVGGGFGFGFGSKGFVNMNVVDFEVLDVIFRGLKASPVAWTSFKGAEG